MFDNMYRILKNCSEHNYCHKVYSNNSKKYFQKRVFKVFRILFNFFWNKCTYIYICKTDKDKITILYFYRFFEQI